MALARSALKTVLNHLLKIWHVRQQTDRAPQARSSLTAVIVHWFLSSGRHR